MDDVRDLLEAERLDARRRLASLTGDYASVVTASRDDNADDEHDPEGATIAFERSQIGSLIRRAEERLGEVDAALARVDGGTYGICERCGHEIAEARLRARPTARTCRECAA